jgi:hypothetical protein
MTPLGAVSSRDFGWIIWGIPGGRLSCGVISWGFYYVSLAIFVYPTRRLARCSKVDFLVSSILFPSHQMSG